MNRCLMVLLAFALLVWRLQAQAPAATSAGVVRTGNISPIVENLDRSLAFYETLLQLQVPPNRGGGPRSFMVNPGLHKMFGTTGATGDQPKRWSNAGSTTNPTNPSTKSAEISFWVGRSSATGPMFMRRSTSFGSCLMK